MVLLAHKVIENYGISDVFLREEERLPFLRYCMAHPPYGVSFGEHQASCLWIALTLGFGGDVIDANHDCFPDMPKIATVVTLLLGGCS